MRKYRVFSSWGGREKTVEAESFEEAIKKSKYSDVQQIDQLSFCAKCGSVLDHFPNGDMYCQHCNRRIKKDEESKWRE